MSVYQSKNCICCTYLVVKCVCIFAMTMKTGWNAFGFDFGFCLWIPKYLCIWQINYWKSRAIVDVCMCVSELLFIRSIFAYTVFHNSCTNLICFVSLRFASFRFSNWKQFHEWHACCVMLLRASSKMCISHVFCYFEIEEQFNRHTRSQDEMTETLINRFSTKKKLIHHFDYGFFFQLLSITSLFLIQLHVPRFVCVFIRKYKIEVVSQILKAIERIVENTWFR